jgi:MFS family permease
MSDSARWSQQGAFRLGGAKIAQIIAAAGVGTMIEWYDFYIFGSLALIISRHFYPTGNPTTALLATFATFGAGFAARPFGALFFGRIGDIVGRKYTFLVTLLIMGGATFLIGVLPDFAKIGVAAPVILVTLRLFQGLALGGEYGGAATYVAEHVADNRRGFYTSFIQTTATLGLFASLLVILAVQHSLPAADWEAWGWRVPFLLSFILVGISLFIRLRLRESPMFQAIKTSGRTSSAPITDSFGSLVKWQTLLMVLWGATAGQAVVWYTGQFYALSWLQGKGTANVPFTDSYVIIAVALALATPFFVVFGALSDRIGRMKIMMAGNLLGAVLTLPIFLLMHRFTPVANNYQPVLITLCVFCLVLLVTMVYGPIAAFLVESFPSKVRYTSVSLPYHIGNGYFGGFLPLIATALVASATRSSDANWKAWAPYAGLAFPIAVAAITFVVGSLLLRETKNNAMEDELMVTQRGFAWPVFSGLVALSVVALLIADQFLTPTLNTSAFNVQWFFRLLALVVVVLSLVYAAMRRLRHGAVSPPPPSTAGI